MGFGNYWTFDISQPANEKKFEFVLLENNFNEYFLFVLLFNCLFFIKFVVYTISKSAFCNIFFICMLFSLQIFQF